MTSSSDQSMPPPPPSFEYDTIIKNIAQANGEQVINDIDDFLTQEGISLGFTQGSKNTQSIEDAALLERLGANDIDPQHTRQCVRSYFTNVERMQDLETDSVKTLKSVEKTQVALEEIIKDLEHQKDSL